MLTSLRRHCISRFYQWTGERLAGVNVDFFFGRTVRSIVLAERDALKVQLLQRQEKATWFALVYDRKEKVTKF